MLYNSLVHVRETGFEGSIHHKYLLEKHGIKGSDRELEMGGRDKTVRNQCAIGTVTTHTKNNTEV